MCPACNGKDTVENALGINKTCVGVWLATSATLDGQAENPLGGVWTITGTQWTLAAAGCTANGTMTLDGSDITMTVTATTCPPTIPAPQGATATGTCDVTDDNQDMTLTLSNSALLGVTHTLVTENSRQD